MSRDTDTQNELPGSVFDEWPRRTVLKITGAGAAIAALGGGSTTGAGQEEDDGESGDDQHTSDDDGDDEDDDRHFVGDLIDPTFGYPLAADESDDVDVEHVVDVYAEEGPGDHENFPLSPEPGAGGEGSEFPLEFAFDPVGIQVTTADIVKFQNGAGEHTVTAFHEKFSVPQREMPSRVPDGSPGFTSPPFYDGESWLYQFPEPGVYDVLCLPHLGFGMVMRAVVTDPGAEDAADSSAPTAGPLPPNAQAVFDAPELDPANVVDQGTVAWADLTLELRGMEAEETEAATDGAPTVRVYDHPEYGAILVGPDEMTLYTFNQDTQGEEQSACSGGCADAWPPLTTDGDPVAGDDVTAELSTFEREDGGTQVTASGWPLYYFAEDEAPGDASGQGVNDVWWVLRPDGSPVRGESTA